MWLQKFRVKFILYLETQEGAKGSLKLFSLGRVVVIFHFKQLEKG